ncbi:MAG TPA: hypothetical protein VM122_01805 [Usitatibacter sp.]|nr:hypothetical protein [Usitatibacter sp.]
MRDDLPTVMSGDSSGEGLRDHASLKTVAATFAVIATVVAATLAFPGADAGSATVASVAPAPQAAAATAAKP